MASRKTIELTFSDDESKTVNCKEINNNKPDDSFEDLNFGGLVIGVKKASKATEVNNINQKDAHRSLTVIAVNTVNKPELITKQIQVKPDAAVRQRELITMRPKDLDTVASKQMNEVAEVKPKAKDPPNEPDRWDPPLRNEIPAEKPMEQERKVDPPQVTEEDWKIFKQFMDPLPKPRSDDIAEVSADGSMKLFKNHQDFVCSICERFIRRRQGAELKACSHNFCRECLIDEIKHQHDAMGQVKCPFKITKCRAFIGDDEVRILLGDDYGQFALEVMQHLNNALNSKKQKDEAAALLKTDELNFIENTEEFECKICYTEVEAGSGVTLKSCHHQFCKECIVDVVKHCEEVEVKCPFMGDDGKSCEFMVQEREIRALVPPELFEKYLERSLKQFQASTGDAYHCKTPDCKGFVMVDKNLLGFKCWQCDKVNCISCKVIHHGKNCQEYQEEVNPNAKHVRENAESENAIKQMVKNGEAMYCPRCGIPVMKQSGCDFMTCGTCKLGICWVTQKPRQPLTKDDGTFIDGCHCREKGPEIFCHPNCKFCH